MGRYLQESYDKALREIERLREERDALAALVEEAKPLIKAYRNQMGARWTLGGDKLEEADKTASWLTSAPYAPLARRDARMKAEALEEAAEACAQAQTAEVSLGLQSMADEYRRQAEEEGAHHG